jgi:hypothetical protein
MKLFVGKVGDREIVGLGNCSVRIRERAEKFPQVFLRYPDRIEQWVLEERNGELHLGGLMAVNQRRCPRHTAGVRSEKPTSTC